jgi:pilus assembly protein CpaC
MGRAETKSTRFAFLLCAVLASVSVLEPRSADAQTRRVEEEHLEIVLNQQTVIPATDIASYSEGPEGVVDVRLHGNPPEFLLVARRVGTTSLLLIHNDGRRIQYSIRVVDPSRQIDTSGGVPVRENIRLDLYFVQLQDSYSHQIGLAFPGSIGGGQVARFSSTLDFLSPRVLTQASMQITNQALPRLDIAQTSGWARLLRQAMLVTANGLPATLNSGGEFNIVVSGGFGGSVQSVSFGSNLQIAPRYDPTTRRIEIAIQADISELTEAGEGGVPGRTRTQLTTTVNLELGQSIVLGGLTSATSRQSQGGLPGLSQIPIFGVLFGTNSRRDERVENVLFVVPTVVQAVPRAQADRIEETLRLYERYGSVIGGPSVGDIELIEPSPPGYGAGDEVPASD